MKKFAALFISFILTASVLFSTYASAAKITDIDQDSGSLTLIKYEQGADTDDDGTPDDTEKRVSGAKFKAYQVIKISKEASGERKYEVAKNFTAENGVNNTGYEDTLDTLADLVSRDEGASFTSTPELLKLIPALRNVAAKLNDTAGNAENGMIYTSTEKTELVESEPGSGEPTEKGTGEYTFGADGKIALGVYLVVETQVPEGYSQVSMPFLVSIPQWTESTDAEGKVTGNWDYNITAYPKDDPINADKKIVVDGEEVDETDANIGDEIKYSIKANIPTYTLHDGSDGLTAEQQKNIKYIFTDDMSKGLTFNEDVFKAEIIQGDGSDNVSLTPGTDYTLTTTPYSETDGTTITADFKWTSLNNYQGEKISISYTAKLNKNAVIGGDVGNPNTALVSYTNDPTLIDSEPQKTPESTTKVFVRTIGMELIKTLNGETPNEDSEIADVVFGMTKVLEDTSESDVWFVKSDDGSYSVYNGELSGEANANGDYTVQIAGESRTVTKKLSPIASGASIGKIIVDGLEEGKYYLSEEKTAAGYNLLSEKVLIDIAFGNSVTVKREGGGELVDDPVVSGDNTHFTITVDNPKQPPLPFAGAQGVISIILGGALLVVGSAILYYLFFKRKRKDNTRRAFS